MTIDRVCGKGFKAGGHWEGPYIAVCGCTCSAGDGGVSCPCATATASSAVAVEGGRGAASSSSMASRRCSSGPCACGGATGLPCCRVSAARLGGSGIAHGVLGWLPPPCGLPLFAPAAMTWFHALWNQALSSLLVTDEASQYLARKRLHTECMRRRG